MAASITASPNPVGFWAPTDKRKTTISWDTGGVNGYVKLRQDTGAELNFDVGTNLSKHSKDFSTDSSPPLALGSSFTFTLYRQDNDKVLAQVTLTTEDLEQRMLDQTSKWAMQQRALGGAPQAITDLTIAAGVDTVRVSFGTVQPTIPSVTVHAADGTQVAAWLPLLGGFQTQHECILGQNVPLDQQTSYQLRIVASGSYFGKEHDAIVTQSFVTGSRKVTLFFDSIKVRKDGDPAGAGEFEFFFHAGDSDGGARLGYALWGEGDISDDDPPVDVSRTIEIEQAPRGVYALVLGVDEDFDTIPYPGEGLPDFYPPTPYQGEGSWWASSYDYDAAWVTRVFPIHDVFGAAASTFEMSTGDFGVAFDVFGRLMVEGVAGTNITVRKTRKGRRYPLSSHAVLTAPGAFDAVGADNGKSRVVGLSADGAIYSKAVGAPNGDSRHEGWARIADGVAGPVTVLAAGPDRIELFALDAEGGLSAATAGSGRPAKGWRRLGGQFVEPVVAVSGDGSRTELLGLAEGGVVLHRSTASGQRSSKDGWEQIGEGVAGSLQALPLRNGGLGVFALGPDGAVLHKRRGPRRWQPAGAKWSSLGGTDAVRLVAEQFDENGVGLATIAADGSLALLLWPDYPAGDPGPWTKRGTLESWLEAQNGNSGTRGGAPRPVAARRKRSSRPSRS
jgi:hypothetical protein